MILRRIGNKNNIAKEIEKHFPIHKIYVEPFFGAGGMFFNKQRVGNNLLNDIDSEVFNLCCVVLCCAVLCYAVLCCVVLCCVVLCCVVLCCAVLCYVVLCCAVLCCVVLCCVVLCCVVM